MENQVDVSIVFVNYKTPKMTLDAINSVIEKSTGFSYEIIVVDNSNDSKEFEELMALVGDKATVIDAKANLGFGKANNLGVSVSKGKYLFFLNTDTFLINNAIKELASYLDLNENVGIVGANLYTKENEPNHSFHKKLKNIKADKADYSIFTSIRNKIIKDRVDFNFKGMPMEIEGYVCGAALMIRHDLFDKMNGFEKDIFMYAEESLLCFRTINEFNYKIFNVPSAKIIHLEGGSFVKKVTDAKIDMYIDGNYIYYKKAFGDNIALKYVKTMIKVISKKVKFAKIFKKDMVEELCAYIDGYKRKISKILDEERRA